MGRGRKHSKKKIHGKDNKEAYVSSNLSVPARNMRKTDIGAVILGCTNSTIDECLSNKLFGLPAQHYSYIKNITEGLPLFLFNYSDRILHGIFEAASHGQMNIDKFAWVGDGDDYTSYPAQVRVRVRQQCHPLSENKFRPIISMNYYESNHFYFELDRGQTNKLISLFQTSPVNSSSLPVPVKRQAYDVMHNWEKEADFDHEEKAKKMGSTSDFPLRPGLSYASALSRNNTSTTATATGSLSTGNWSALFKGHSSFESTNDYERRIQASSSSFSASDASNIIPESSWVTNCPPADQSVQVHEDSWEDVVEEFPLNQEYQDKADFLQENTWEDSQLLATTTDAKSSETGLSYASALSRNNTSTTATATGSLSTGNWSALFKGHSSFESTNDYERRIQASSSSFPASDASNIIPESSWVTNCPPADQSVQVHEDSWEDVVEEFPLNQEYQDKADFLQENTWEDSQLLATTTDAKSSETWVSHLSHQANAATDELQLHQEYYDNANFLQANTWEESEPIATAIDKVDQGQTWVADLSDEHINEPSTSAQPLDDNQDCKQSLSNEENVSDVKEKHEKDNLESLVVKLTQEVEALKVSQLKQVVKVNTLEQELGESKLEIQWLRNRLGLLDFGSPSICLSKFVDSVFIFGGYDGSSWLTTLDSYSPYLDIKSSLSPMNFMKKYASAATLNDELYHFGGEGVHTVESFSLTNNQWVSRPPLLYSKNILVAGASIKDRLFVVGGGDGHQCSSEVQYLDLNVGKWLPTRSMQNMRLAPAAAELNNALYVTGGFDGGSYLSCVERFDPREEAWYKLPSMNARKGCHSMVVLNDKLYTIGGFDGAKAIAAVEMLDTRMGSWVDIEPMNVCRGNFGAFVLGEKLYAIGGMTENNEVLDIVECYKEGSCWEIADLKAIGKRSQFSAIVMK